MLCTVKEYAPLHEVRSTLNSHGCLENGEISASKLKIPTYIQTIMCTDSVWYAYPRGANYAGQKQIISSIRDPLIDNLTQQYLSRYNDNVQIFRARYTRLWLGATLVQYVRYGHPHGKAFLLGPSVFRKLSHWEAA